MATLYVGLDVHWRHTTVRVLNGQGKRVKRLTIRGPWSEVADEVRKLSRSGTPVPDSALIGPVDGWPGQSAAPDY